MLRLWSGAAGAAIYLFISAQPGALLQRRTPPPTGSFWPFLLLWPLPTLPFSLSSPG